jgi:hypothetical protein
VRERNRDEKNKKSVRDKAEDGEIDYSKRREDVKRDATSKGNIRHCARSVRNSVLKTLIVREEIR